MRITLPRADLSRVLSATTRVVESRNNIPILSNVLLIVADGRLTARATDLDIEASASVAALDCQDGSITVNAKLLADIAKKASADITMELDGNVLAVRSGRSRYKLPTLPASDFPSFSAGTFDAEFEIDLAALVAPVQFAISTEETRFYLNGVFLHVANDKLVAVATDGHRLSRHVAPSIGDIPEVILPRKLVSILPRGVVRVSLSQTKVRIATDDGVLVSKLIDGTFPDYQRVIPTGNPHRMTADRDALLAAVDRVSVVNDEKGRAVKLDIASGGLVLSVPEKASEEVEVEFSGEPMSIGFNAAYLADALRTLSPGEVTFALNDSGSPTVLMGKNDGLDITLMPMRVG